MEYVSNNSDPHYSSQAPTTAETSPFSTRASRPKRRAGRKKFKETRHPEYRGVRQRNPNKWVCELRDPTSQKRVWLGTYPTPEMAARAHDVAALALRGRAACLNFADSASRLPVPASKDAKELRKTAAEAAEAFRPMGGGEEPKNDDGTRNVSDFLQPELCDILCNEWSAAALAEGVLLSPPPCLGWRFGWDDGVMTDCAELELWSF